MNEFVRPAIAGCLIVLLGSGCGMGGQASAKSTAGQDDSEAKKTAETEVLIPVQAELPTRQDVYAYFETTTNVEAENQVDLTAKGTGQCLSVFVEEGDTVRKGQILAELDKEELEAQIQQSRVQVAQQKSSYEVAQRAAKEGIGTPVDRDNARFAYEQAQKSLEVQEVQLKNLTLRAPISGVVTHRYIQQGMLVTSGTPAFKIVDSSSYVLPINLPERELARVKEGQMASVQIESQPGKVFEATVRRISPNVDLNSGTVKVILDFDKEDREYLMESAFARVKLVMDRHENALVVPKDSLLEENARTYLMVVREQEVAAAEAEAAESGTEEGAEPAEGTESKSKFVAERVEVTVGLEDSNVAEIVGGLEEDSLVVTLGQQTLKDGAVVNVTNAKDEILSRAHLSADEALEQAMNKDVEGEAEGRSGRGKGRRMRP